MHLGFSADERPSPRTSAPSCAAIRPSRSPSTAWTPATARAPTPTPSRARWPPRGGLPMSLAPRLRRPGAPDGAQAHPAGGAGPRRRALRPPRRLRPDRRLHHSLRVDQAPRGDPPAHRPGRDHLLAGLQRAQRRLGPALAQDRGAARRRRLRDPRPQDLVEPRRHRRLRPGAGPHEPRGAPRRRGSACSSWPTPPRAWTSGPSRT